MQTRSGRSPARLAVALASFAVVAAATLPAAGGADPNTSFADRARDLRAQNADLAARSSSALLGLYALDSRLAGARAELAALRRRAATLERRRTDVRLQLRVARRALGVSRQQLADRLHILYVQGDTDPVAVFLGSDSLDDALARMDELDRTAALNERVITQTLGARSKLRRLARALAVETARVKRLEAAAAASAAALEGTVRERRAYLASLASRQRLNDRQIASLEAQAAAARAKTLALSATPASAAVQPGDANEPAVALTSQTLTVTATGYSLPGRTATGLRVGWGVVAVDPSVIPLGTRMTIPGYGEGVAADIGHAVNGAAIDLWFPTRVQALGWGRRTVTITFG